MILSFILIDLFLHGFLSGKVISELFSGYKETSCGKVLNK